MWHRNFARGNAALSKKSENDRDRYNRLPHSIIIGRELHVVILALRNQTSYMCNVYNVTDIKVAAMDALFNI